MRKLRCSRLPGDGIDTKAVRVGERDAVPASRAADWLHCRSVRLRKRLEMADVPHAQRDADEAGRALNRLVDDGSVAGAAHAQCAISCVVCGEQAEVFMERPASVPSPALRSAPTPHHVPLR